MYITLNTNAPTRMPNGTLQQTSSPDITTVSNTLYNRTSWTTQHSHYHLTTYLSSPQSTYDMTIDYRRTFTNYKKSGWTQFTEDRVHFHSDLNTHRSINRATQNIQGYNITLTTTQVQEAIKKNKKNHKVLNN